MRERRGARPDASRSCAAAHQSFDSLSAQLMPSGTPGLGCVGVGAGAVAGCAGAAADAVAAPAAAAAPLGKPTTRTLLTLIGVQGRSPLRVGASEMATMTCRTRGLEGRALSREAAGCSGGSEEDPPGPLRKK